MQQLSGVSYLLVVLSGRAQEANLGTTGPLHILAGISGLVEPRDTKPSLDISNRENLGILPVILQFEPCPAETIKLGSNVDGYRYGVGD